MRHPQPASRMVPAEGKDRDTTASRVAAMIKENPRGADMYFDSEKTSTPSIYHISDTVKTTPVIMMQHPSHDEGSTSRIPPRKYATVASSTNNVAYSRLCLTSLDLASKFPLLSDETRSCIINQRPINLANFLQRNSYGLDNQRATPRGKSTPTAFRLQKGALKRNGRTLPNTHPPGNIIHSTHSPKNCGFWNSGATTSSTRMSGTATQAAASSSHPG